MLRSLTACACLLLLSLTANLSAQQPHRGRVYVDRGVCGDGWLACGRHPWKPHAKTILRARPNVAGRKVGEVQAGGPCVLALTGEVHVRVPGEFVMVRPHEGYRPGDVLALYTYHGESVYKVRHRGRWIAEVALPGSPTHSVNRVPSSRQECEATPRCWGYFKREPDSETWIKVRTPDGLVGWTNQPENFSQPHWQSAEDCRELNEELRQRRQRRRSR